MIINDGMGLDDLANMGDLGFSLRKTLKKIAPHNLIKKISPVQAIRRAVSKPKKSGGGAPPPAAAAPMAPAGAPAGGSSLPIPGGYFVEGNDAAGNYVSYYFPDVASANAYNQSLMASGGYGTVSATPAAQQSESYAQQPYPASGPAYGPSGGGGYGPGYEDQDPYADEGEGEEAPAADEEGEEEAAPRPSRLPKAPAVAPVAPTIAPTMAGSIPMWMWIAGGVVVAGGTYMVLKKKGIL